MSKPKIAILGAGSIGKFHAREFHNAGCEVVAILGSTEETSNKTAQDLYNLFGIRAKPYNKIETLLEHEQLDAVSICTPPRLHAGHVKKCLESGLHVLCEKPFVLDSTDQNYSLAKALFKLAKKKKRILSVNTQWAYIIESLSPHIDLSHIKDFSMYIEPGIPGQSLITEGIPHMNSLLLKLIKDGKIKNIEFPILTLDNVEIAFDYKNKKDSCKVKYTLKLKETRPRAFKFTINGEVFTRVVQDNYAQKLEYSKGEIAIEDPLKTSIRRFVSAISGRENKLLTEKEILENVKLQDEIMSAYLCQEPATKVTGVLGS